MSQLILLPGNSAGNREGFEALQSRLGGTILYYQHWSTGEPMIDFETEARRLAELANDSPVRVIAKSAGCLLAMRAVREAAVDIEKAVFLGTAVLWGEERGIPVREWLQEWSVPTLFIHKEQDPVIAVADLQAIVNRRHEILALPGNDHNYDDLDVFIEKAGGMLI